jgi:hypothetical protein
MWHGSALCIVNAFAANDVQSTLALWQAGLKAEAALDEGAALNIRTSLSTQASSHTSASVTFEIAGESTSCSSRNAFRVLVFNHRQDRAWRAYQLGELAKGIEADAVLVYSLSENLARRRIRHYYRADVRAKNLHKDRARCATQRRPLVRKLKNPSLEALLKAIEIILSSISTEKDSSSAEGSVQIAILLAGNFKGPGSVLTTSLTNLSSFESLRSHMDASDSDLRCQGAF